LAATVHMDKALARRILDGDERAFRSMFDRFFPRLYRYAVARLDGDDDGARDVVQQTFCRAIEKLDSYRGEAALYAWFCRICHNCLVDHCRKMNQDTQRLLRIEDNLEVQAVLEALTAADVENPESRARQRDLGRLVQSVLDYLPERYGDVLEWKYVEGLSVKEIAARMETGPKAVESMLTRARNSFREAFAALPGAASATDGMAQSQGIETI
jgi:RNA polymerase sigma-70 factor (ECF subfamily)